MVHWPPLGVVLSGELLTATEGSAADVVSASGGLPGMFTSDCGLAGCFGFGARCLETGVVLGKDMEILQSSGCVLEGRSSGAVFWSWRRGSGLLLAYSYIAVCADNTFDRCSCGRHESSLSSPDRQATIRTRNDRVVTRIISGGYATPASYYQQRSIHAGSSRLPFSDTGGLTVLRSHSVVLSRWNRTST